MALSTDAATASSSSTSTESTSATSDELLTTKSTKNTASTSSSTTIKSKQPFSHVMTGEVSQELQLYEAVTFEKQYQNSLPNFKQHNSNNCSSSNIRSIPTFHWKDMVIESVLGQGSFSFVFETSLATASNNSETTTGRNNNNSKKNTPKMALKCLKASSVQTSEDLIYNAMDLYSEANLLERLNPHPHIITILGTCELGLAESFQYDDGYFILLEVIKETLQDRLQSWRSTPDEYAFDRLLEKPQIIHRLQTIALPVVQAMEYIHSQNIVLRDLKPENIGFDAKNGSVKLFDFGLARSADLLKEETDLAGSILYMAPEVLRTSSSPTGVTVGFESDVYSFAICLWELCTLEIPLRKFTTLEEVEYHIGQKKWRPSLSGIPSSKIKNLLQQAWKVQPSDRPSFAQIRPMLETIVYGGAAITTSNQNGSGTSSNNNGSNGKKGFLQKMKVFSK